MSTADEEFAWAVRALLAQPFITRGADVWPAIVANSAELTDYFEDGCGWTLDVDARRGSARLLKRHREPDPTRPLRRENGTAMRRGGYAILLFVASELVSRPTTTVGDLADNLAAASLADTTLPAFDATVYAHRLLFVDALHWFVSYGFAQVTAGDLERYSGGTGDAVVVADAARFSELLATATPPSRVTASSTADWVTALTAEPRYQLVLDGRGDADAVNRFARHQLGRRLLDDPCMEVASLSEDQQRYLASIAGRGVVRAAVERAGFVLEEASDVLVAVDPTGEATDRSFGRTVDTVTQVAVAVLDEVKPNRDTVDAVPVEDVEAFVADLLADDLEWAAAYQKPGGARALARAALDVLVAFNLVTVDETADVADMTTPSAPDPADPATHDPEPGGPDAGIADDVSVTRERAARLVRPAPSAARFVTNVIDNRSLSKDTP